MKNNLENTYYAAKSGAVEGPDPAFVVALSPRLRHRIPCEAYSAPQFSAIQSDILSKIVSLSDWLLTQQCSDPERMRMAGSKVESPP
jgi:hypothetical protein